MFVRQSVSCLDNRLSGEFAGCLVGELAFIVCLLVGCWRVSGRLVALFW